MITKRNALDRDEIRSANSSADLVHTLAGQSEGLSADVAKVHKAELERRRDVERKFLISPRACVAYPAVACVRSLQEKLKMTLRSVRRLFQRRVGDERMAEW
jgi:hypothetical protein